MTHPFHDVAIVGLHNTVQGKVLEGYDSESITLEHLALDSVVETDDRDVVEGVGHARPRTRAGADVFIDINRR